MCTSSGGRRPVLQICDRPHERPCPRTGSAHCADLVRQNPQSAAKIVQFALDRHRYHRHTPTPGERSMEASTPGPWQGPARFAVTACGFAVALHERDEVPPCPECGGRHVQPRVAVRRRGAEAPDHHDLDERRRLARGGPRRARRPGATTSPSRTDERVRVVPLQEGWTRVGRSLSAHVRFDDPTVSRRHALVYRDDDGRADPGRPQPQRRLLQRRARGARRARGRRRDRGRSLSDVLPEPRGGPPGSRRLTTPPAPPAPARAS